MTLVEFLQQHGIDYRLSGQHRHVRGDFVGVDCPHCGPDSGKFHAGIQEDLSRASCWRCGGLRPFDLLAELTRMPWHAVRSAITGPRTPEKGPSGAAKRKGSVLYPPGLQPLSGPHRRYLAGRGFCPDAITDLWGVQATGPVDHLAWRLWIPIHLNGQVVSWTTRAIGSDVEPRYISASPDQEEINHKALLYGEDLAEHAVVVVEGPLDAWAIGPGAVAILGLMTTPHQIERLGRYPVRAICTDAEPAAMRRAEQLADLLQQYPGITDVIELETGGDPAEADPSEIREIRRRWLDCQFSDPKRKSE